MHATDSIPVKKVAQSRLSEVDFSKLEFARYMADHMSVAEFKDGSWGNLEIVPYGNISVSPATAAFHYGQSIFEGMKAFRMADGNVNIFRPLRHHQRINKSLDRMCMPTLSEEMFMTALQTLIELDHGWVPKGEGEALYIRPLVFASEAKIKVKVSDEYKFMVMNSPVGVYLAKPFRLKVEDHYVRTAEGGTGFAKCAGNYGGSYYPTQLAVAQGYDQVLWTDSREHKYIDEVGMMNVMFVLDGKLITPKLNTAILDGITRDSILTLVRDMGFPVEERRISLAEIEDGFKRGAVKEAFGCGTAAVVSAIATINMGGIDYTIAAPTADSIQLQVKKKLNDMRLGLAEDVYGWNHVVKV